MSPSYNSNNKTKFILDENVDVRLAKFFEDRGYSVELCPKGIENGKLYSLACENSQILVTNDKDFANPELYDPSKSPGIIVFRIHPPSYKNLAEALEGLFGKLTPRELKGKLLLVGAEGVEIVSSVADS